MAQSLDQSVSSTTASSIYVIGQPQNDLPIELFYAARDAEFENRYDRSNDFFVNIDNNQGGNQVMQWTILQSDSFMRSRSMMAGFCFALPNSIYGVGTGQGGLAVGAGYGGYFALTPLPAFTVTYWDSIQMLLGYNATPVYTMNQTQHIPFMMRYMGHTKITHTNSTSLAMAGIFYWRNFDYNGGVVGALNATYIAGGATGYPGEPTTYNTITQVPLSNTISGNISQPPYNAQFGPSGQNLTVFQNFSTVPAANAPIRQCEGGLWQDKGMQQLRIAFYGSPDCTTMFGACKLDIISECFQTPCVMPPVPITLKFQYPFGNTIRPRYINTPGVIPGTTTGTIVDFIPMTFTGFTPTLSNCYMLYETVAFRADMHAAVLLAWKNNAGINDRFRSYDWYTQGQIQTQTIQINLIQANNFVSYQSLVGFRMQDPYPGGSYTSGGATWTQGIPQLNQYVPYGWSECNIKTITALYTIPNNLSQQRINWQNGGVEPINYAAITTAQQSQRGILDLQSAWNDCYQDQLWFTHPNYSDWRFNNQLKDRYMSITQNLPVGWVAQANAANVTTYGTKSWCAPGTLNQQQAWGTGPHNQFIQFNYNGQNFTEEIQDYGTAMGSLRMTLNFYSPPPAPGVIFDQLMPYLININYQGTLNVTTSLQIN